jgi:hypothetical protein
MVNIDAFGLDISVGLVEIAALSTLVSSSTAESLALGNRGAIGLAWAPLSLFEAMSIIKACLSASIPGWIRESLGVRNSATDSAIGLILDLGMDFVTQENKARRNLDSAVGIACERKFIRPSKDHDEKTFASDNILVGSRDVYAFDQFTANQSHTTPTCSVGESLNLLIDCAGPESTGNIVRKDWLKLALSLIKISELLLLWIFGATVLGCVSSLAWFYFFISAVILKACNLARGPVKNFHTGQYDIIAGQLPRTRNSRRERKILLGVHKNFRHNIYWQVIWGVGSVICIITLVCCYLLLLRATSSVAYLWIGFQIFWLFPRSTFFHSASSTNNAMYPVRFNEPYERLPMDLKCRVWDLMFALARYQSYCHPRKPYCYEADILTSTQMTGLIGPLKSNLLEVIPVELFKLGSEILQVTFDAVIGDTVLSSLAWLQGSKLTSLGLYDSCLLQLTISDVMLVIPAVRTLCKAMNDAELDVTQVEKGQVPRTVPKGMENWGLGYTQWSYWIPCSDGRWLYALSGDFKVLGKRKVEFLTDDELSRRLRAGVWGISHEETGDFMNVVALSRQCASMVVSFFG